MTGACTVCQAPEVAEIDSALLAGMSQRSVADAFRRNPSSIRRHARNHLELRLLEAAGRRSDIRHDDLLDRLLRLVAEAEEVLAASKAAGDQRGILAAVREVRDCLKIAATVTRDPSDHDVELQALVSALGRVLPRFPDAALALASELTALGAEDAGDVIAASVRRSSSATLLT